MIANLAAVADKGARKLRFWMLSSFLLAAWIVWYCYSSVGLSYGWLAVVAVVCSVPMLVFFIFYWALNSLAGMPEALGAAPRQLIEDTRELGDASAGSFGIFKLVRMLWSLGNLKSALQSTLEDGGSTLSDCWFAISLITNPLALALLLLAFPAWIVLFGVALLTAFIF